VSEASGDRIYTTYFAEYTGMLSYIATTGSRVSGLKIQRSATGTGTGT